LLILKIYKKIYIFHRFQVSGPPWRDRSWIMPPKEKPGLGQGENPVTTRNPSLKAGPYPRIEVSGVRNCKN
jgi:hypothetical protein